MRIEALAANVSLEEKEILDGSHSKKLIIPASFSKGFLSLFLVELKEAK